MDKFSIEFYTKENGEKPAKDFLMNSDKKMRAKLSGILELLEEYGNQIREPYSKHLEDGIFEVRGKVGNDIERISWKGRRKVMSEFREFLNEQLKDPEFRQEYENLEPEFDIIRAMIETRKQQHITQKELSERTGITQADISRIENGTRNPSLDMIKRLAKGMGMRLRLEFIPEHEQL